MTVALSCHICPTGSPRPAKCARRVDLEPAISARRAPRGCHMCPRARFALARMESHNLGPRAELDFGSPHSADVDHPSLSCLAINASTRPPIHDAARLGRRPINPPPGAPPDRPRPQRRAREPPPLQQLCHPRPRPGHRLGPESTCAAGTADQGKLGAYAEVAADAGRVSSQSRRRRGRGRRAELS